MKIGVIGGVSSTAVLINKLSEYKFSNVKVWSYHPKDTDNVSGWYDLSKLSLSLGFKNTQFIKVQNCYEDIKKFNPDILFIVGLSQLIPQEILDIPKMGCVGFHPTALPKGRGRAPIAWLTLEKQDGATTFFFLREGVDDGPIIVQQPFQVHANDDATSVEDKVLKAEKIALDKLLIMLQENRLKSIEQNENDASWYGRRTPADGLIHWDRSVDSILHLIQASTAPHPGAFTYQNNNKIKIWSASIYDKPIKGVIGRILEVDDKYFVIQCANGLLKVTNWESNSEWEPRVGMLLGYYTETEIYNLRAHIQLLEKRLEIIESKYNDLLN